MPLKGKDQFQVFAFSTVIQKAIIPDLLKTGREHMHQITADELDVFQSDHPARFTGLFPPGRKSDLLFIGRKDTAVGNGNLVGISSEIFHRIAKSMESFFYVRAPFLSIKEIAEFRPFIGIPEFITGSGKNQAAVFVKRIEPCKKFPLEFIPEDFYPEKEAVLYLPYLMVGGKPTTGDNAVHMNMVIDFLVPGVEHLDDPGCCSEMLFICRKF